MPVITPNFSYSVTTSGQKIIKRALRLLGAIASGEELEANELQDALEALNGMLDTWNTDGDLVYSRSLIEKDMDGSTSYTIGEDSSNSIVTMRPERIDQGQAFFRAASGQEYELDVWNQRQWGQIWNKSYATEYPCVLYYDKAYEAGSIQLWPRPSTGTLLLYLDTKLAQIQQASVLFRLPPAFYDALCYNLAIRLAPEWDTKATPELIATAMEAKVGIKRMNHVDSVMSVDPALLSSCVLADWTLGAGGGSVASPSILQVSADTTLNSSNRWLFVEATGGVGGITLTFPAPPSSGSNIISVIKMDSAAGAVNISATTNVGSSYQLVNQNQNVTFVSDGSQWVIQSNN